MRIPTMLFPILIASPLNLVYNESSNHARSEQTPRYQRLIFLRRAKDCLRLPAPGGDRSKQRTAGCFSSVAAPWIFLFHFSLILALSTSRTVLKSRSFVGSSPGA